MIKNERIRIYPASQEQMEKCIDSETDEELKKAYSEMLEGCLAHHEEWDWYAMWTIVLHRPKWKGETINNE